MDGDMEQRQSREIWSQLRLRPRDWWIVAAATLGAVVVAVVIVSPAITYYRTTSVVGLDPASQAANDRVDFVADMRAAVSQPSVLDNVADPLGLDGDDLDDDLSVERIDDSNLIRIVYEAEDRDPETAKRVVESVPAYALQFLRAGKLSAAERASTSAQEVFDVAVKNVSKHRQRLNDALTANDFIRPDAELDSIRRELDGARIALLGLDPVLDADQIDATNTIIDTLETQLEASAEDAVAFGDLEDELEFALEDCQTVASELHDAKREVVAASAGPSVTVQTVEAERSDKRLVVLKSVGLPLLVGVVTAAAISWLRGRRTAPAASDD